MKSVFSAITILIFVTCLVCSRGALAQGPGPAGAGAAEAAGGGSSSSRSYNPLKFFAKKDAKPGLSAVSVAELDKRLEPKLRESKVLAGDATLKQVCANFIERFDCLAALHASQSLNLNFECVTSNVTGVRVGTDSSSGRMPSGDKPLSLVKTIHLLKSDADAKNAARDAETAAREDIKDATS